MSEKRIGRQTVRLEKPVSVLAGAAVGGEKEGDGPLGRCFDYISEDSYFGEASWEKAESRMLKQCFSLACDKANIAPSSLDAIFGGDLLNQCTASCFAMRDSGAPFFGLYGACSTMAEAAALAAMFIDGGFGSTAAAQSCSHFCSAERQFRFPLEYGGQRTPTAQWTVTAAGALILGRDGGAPYITHVTAGKIVDAGICDAANMGAAMAPAAFDTLTAHFEDTGRSPQDYDIIVTGDLGYVGSKALAGLFEHEGIELENHLDCGLMIFDRERQDVHAGGSGCGCCASVLASLLLSGMREGRWNRMLFAATGALMSPTTSQQGESIPGICHAVAFDTGVQ